MALILDKPRYNNLAPHLKWEVAASNLAQKPLSGGYDKTKVVASDEDRYVVVLAK